MTIQDRMPDVPEGGKARRVYLLLRGEVAGGDLRPGDTLPGEDRLAARFGVSRVTVRRALKALAEEGLITRRAGAGTVVCDRGFAGAGLAADFASLMPQLVEMEARTTARLLAFSYGAAPDPVARALGLDPGARVQCAQRVRMLDGQPFSHLTTHVPESIAGSYSEADLATTPLFRLLERSGVTVAEAHQSVSATLAAPDVAEALGVAVGAPLLSIIRVVRDAAGRGVEHLSALYRADLFRLEMTLSRVGAAHNRHWAPVMADPADGGIAKGKGT